MTTLGRLLVVAAVLVSFVGVGHADEKKELEAVKGTWTLTKHEIDGNDAGGTEDSKLAVTLDGEKYAVRLADVVVQEGRMKLDTSKSPRTIDLAIGEGQNKGVTMLGIYRIDGDTFKACFDITGKARPTEFKTSADSNRLLVEAKRMK